MANRSVGSSNSGSSFRAKIPIAGLSQPGIFSSIRMDRNTKKSTLLIAIVARTILFSLIIYSIENSFSLGTNPLALCIAALLGTSAGSVLANSNLSMRGCLVLSGCSYLFYRVAFFLLFLIPQDLFPNMFSLYVLQTHLNLILLVTFVCGTSTYVFWRWKHGLTIEGLVLFIAAIHLLSGHRDFHFEFPQVVGSLAWALGTGHLQMFIVLGAVIFFSVLIYLFMLNPSTEQIGRFSQRIEHKGQKRAVLGSIFLVIAGLFFYVISSSIFKIYQQEVLIRTANGVGQEDQEKMSPLGFHSALGGTNQPSALVRLEGDYSNNPYSPMMYLRESALSEFNGREMVNASRAFDRDISHSRPDEPFAGEEDTELMSRTPVTQSVFLLSEHKSAFALDYPISITQLKNPNPSRFKAAYRVYSVAPGFSRDELDSFNVGDPRWSEDERKHYLVPHSDPRYAALANQITKDVKNPIKKAQAITDYLSEVAIYTLTPGHEVKDDQDPVAPFLFGDRRGYCVHFAHAITYMLRALGIPARVATGYLTDLSQSKDGHILLRMSDRHAWSEVYVDEHGWIPFDPQPTHVESHAETPVDMKLLEELMGMIGPGEEILPKDLTESEPNSDIPSDWILPDGRYSLIPVLVILLAIFIAKLFLLSAWKFGGRPETRVRRAYLALVSRLYDLGIRRIPGETRNEFQIRVSQNFQVDISGITQLLGFSAYAPKAIESARLTRLVEMIHSPLKQISQLPRWKRIIGIFSPRSAVAFLLGQRF